MKKTLIFALCFILSLSACATQSKVNSVKEISSSSQASQVSENMPISQPTEDSLNISSMTIEEKVGQLFIIRPEALHNSNITLKNTVNKEDVVNQFTAEMAENLAKYHVGGVAFFAGNIVGPNELLKFTTDLQSNSKIPLFIAVDEEGGLVARLANSPSFNLQKYQSMEAIGNTNDPNTAYNVGYTIGRYLNHYGFNLNFAPIADINTNPDNRVIASRAFGSDSNLVATMVAANIAGAHDADILATLKHFPGHGDTQGDSHDGYVTVEKTWDKLMQGELIPFVASLKETDLIMVAHIATPNVTADGLPASLSKEMIEGKLRGELGYNGVVITDALEMGAITANYNPAQAAVFAVLAGVDILLMPENFAEAYEAVVQAVKEGTISMERLDQSVSRILKLKENF